MQNDDSGRRRMNDALPERTKERLSRVALPPGKYRTRTASSQIRIGRSRLFTSACGFQLEKLEPKRHVVASAIYPSKSRSSSQWRGSIAAVEAVMEFLLQISDPSGPIEVEVLTLQEPIADIFEGLASPKRDLDRWENAFSLRRKLQRERSITIIVRFGKLDRRWQQLKDRVTAAAISAASELSRPSSETDTPKADHRQKSRPPQEESDGAEGCKERQRRVVGVASH